MPGKTLLTAGGALLALTLAALFYLQSRTPVTIQADGELRRVHTHALTVGDALHEAGVELAAGDRVQPAPAESLIPNAVIVVQRAHLVQVEADGQTLYLRTQSNDPAQILSDLNLALGPNDTVWADGARSGSERGAAAHLAVRRAVPVTLTDGGAAFAIETAARTVGEALAQRGVQLYRADVVQPALETLIAADMTISILRARPVTIRADGRVLQSRTQHTLVGDILAQAQVALVGQDYAVPAVDQPVPADGAIRVVRVREEILTEQERIAFETLYQALPDREIDTVLTLQAGVNGSRRRFIRVRYEDGVEVSRLTENEFVAQAAVPQVIGYGTNIVIRTVATPDGVLEYWRAYTMYATSYSPSRAGVPRTARNFGITASGRPLVKGLVAIDRRYIPFGTSMYVPGYGFAVAADTGGGVKGRWIDLGYDDNNYVSWHQVVTVYFLTPVPPADQITWIIPATVP
jgi:uncharacterized protein YabE (DUF348 family)